MLIKDIFIILQLIFDKRNLRLLYNVHKELSKDRQYSFINMLKSMWLISKDEKVVKFNDVYVVSSFFPPIPSKAFFQVFMSTPNKNSKFYEHVHAIRTAPISMFIAVTEKCNYNCWHCSKANRKNKRELSLNTIKKLMKELQDMGVAIIGITGGEPLLRKDLVKIISSIDDRSISVLFTTGQNLTLDKAKQLKKAGLFSVGISLDHYDKQVYDKMRGYNGAYDTALKAIDYCMQAGLYTMIQTVATKEMIKNDDVWKMIDFARDLKVNEIRFLETMPTGRLINIEQKDILTQKEKNKLIEIHKKASWSGKQPKVSVFAKIESFSQFGCGAGTQHSYIDAEGNLYPCDFVPMSYGNIKGKPIRELWKEMNNDIGVPRDICLIMETYKKIRKGYKGKLPLKKTDSKTICSECKVMKELPGFYSTLRGRND